eukprot:TRINITY_DN22684_c0_g1_i2.p1 TRINITY_DN22684_c0_g1~~TRINITY_DN22684_c0_g1_i2.p1  ORF type:complete len:119 (-),score=3.16 TRINITY_DN22684_c0_g1_i2:130-486(-)
MTSSSVYTVKRFSQEEAFKIHVSWLRSHRKPARRSYSSISNLQRYQILRDILSRELTVTEASVKYKLKYTTIKNILKIYKKEGRIEKKRTRGKLVKQRSTLSKTITYSPQARSALLSP